VSDAVEDARAIRDGQTYTGWTWDARRQKVEERTGKIFHFGPGVERVPHFWEGGPVPGTRPFFWTEIEALHALIRYVRDRRMDLLQQVTELLDRDAGLRKLLSERLAQAKTLGD
jgi:hypothetical protein